MMRGYMSGTCVHAVKSMRGPDAGMQEDDLLSEERVGEGDWRAHMLQGGQTSHSR